MADQAKSDAKTGEKVTRAPTSVPSPERAQLEAAVQTLPVPEQLAALQPERPLQFNLASTDAVQRIKEDREDAAKRVRDLQMMLERLQNAIQDQNVQVMAEVSPQLPVMIGLLDSDLPLPQTFELAENLPPIPELELVAQSSDDGASPPPNKEEGAQDQGPPDAGPSLDLPEIPLPPTAAMQPQPPMALELIGDLESDIDEALIELDDFLGGE